MAAITTSCTNPTAAANTALGVNGVGANMSNMGIGLLGAAATTLKRKFRYLFGIRPNCSGTTAAVSPSFVKTAGRPNITIEDTEINFLNETAWVPGKAKWETIDITYYDAAGANSANLFTWLRSVYDYASECRSMGGKPADYGATATIVMLDGCGTLLETWTLINVWPSAIKFGDLDYGSSDIAEVMLTLRYSQVTYQPGCGAVVGNPCCTPCT